MFILTCPSCTHRLKVKFARIGAMATCPSCKHKFAVDQKCLMAVQEHTSAAGAGPGAPADRPAQGGDRPAAPMPRPRGKTRRPVAPPAPTVPQTPARHAHPGPVTVAQTRDPAANELAALAHATRRPVHRRKGGGLSVKLIAALLVVAVTLGTVVAILVYVVKNGPITTTVTLVDKDGNRIDPSALQKKADSNAVSSGNPNDPSTFVNLAPGSPGAMTPGATGTPAAAVPADAPLVKPPAPMLKLELLALATGPWTPIDPPGSPLTPLNTKEADLWTPRLEKDPDTDRTVFTTIYLDEDGQVYEQGFLQVQLLDANGRAIAEFKQPVPGVTARAGVQIRVDVPEELAAKAVGVVADLTPLDPIDKAVPIQMDEGSLDMVGGTTGAPVLEMAVYNPHTFPVTDATVMIELLADDGYVLGIFRGQLRGKIEPNTSMAFRIEPRLPENSAASRVKLRGFALKL